MIQRKSTLTDGKKRWYAHPVPVGEIDLEGLARHMSMHNTPYSEGQIKGVLHDFITCFSELLQEGKKVKIDNLGLFGIGISATQVAKPGDFSPNKNIYGVHLNCSTLDSLPLFKRLLGTPKIEQMPKYVVNKKDKSDTEPSDNPGA